MTDKPIQSSESKKHFPPVKQLILESWELLTKKALKLLFLGILSIAVYVILFVLGIMAVFSLGALHISSFADIESVREILSSPRFIGTAIYIGIIFFVILIVVGTVMQAAILILLKDPKEETPVIDYFKQGFSYLVPLFVVGLITSILVFGSFFVFFFPGIIIGIFLMFVVYAVVIDNIKGMTAIKTSVSMISQNFGAIVGRIILLWLLSFAIQMMIGILPHENPSAIMFYVFASFVASFTIGWFGLAYCYRLYEHAKASFDPKKKTSMTWMWIISVLGWIICGLLITGFVSAINSKDIQNTIQNSIVKEMQTGKDKDINTNFKSDFEGMMQIDQQILTLLNKARVDKNLVPLLEDQQLCGYAARRLKQIDDFGGFDDYAGFYEDTGDKSIWSTFFKGYQNVTNIIRDRMNASQNEATNIARSIIEQKDNNAVLTGEYTHICIRENDDFVSFVLGEKKEIQSL